MAGSNPNNSLSSVFTFTLASK